MKVPGAKFTGVEACTMPLSINEEAATWAVDRGPWNSRGFTLLEVMIALAILGLGIVTVLELLSGSLNIGVKASRHTQAAIYAQNTMDRLFARTTLQDGDERGEFPDGYVWQARVQEIRPDDDRSRLQPNRPNQTDLFHLKEIEVQISWSENGGAQSFVLRSLRTQAEQPDNGQNTPSP